MRDFSLKIYRELLTTICNFGYNITTLKRFLLKNNSRDKIVILRHDVDKKPENALLMAALENTLGAKSSYYFRTTKDVYNKEIIENIFDMGHEIGYHYEVLANSKGNYEKAIKLFEKELKAIRKIVPVETISMHGSPLSKWKNCDLWNKYDFRDYGIKGDIFLSVDFDKIAYFTDTGRCWEGKKYNIRDNIKSGQDFRVKTTKEMISLFESIELKKVMINVHPQRWNDNIWPWIKELLWQNTKNFGKFLLRKLR